MLACNSEEYTGFFKKGFHLAIGVYISASTHFKELEMVVIL